MIITGYENLDDAQKRELNDFWVEALGYKSSVELWENACLNGAKLGVVALNDDGKIIGCAFCHRQFGIDGWVIFPIAVHRDFRRSGIGRRLLEELETRCRCVGGKYLFADSSILVEPNDHHVLKDDLVKHGDIDERCDPLVAFFTTIGFSVLSAKRYLNSERYAVKAAKRL